MKNNSQKEISNYCPDSQSEWRNWLENNHKTEQAVWLVYYKKATDKASLSWSAAVDEALCFGWIDSTKKSIDSERYMQYFSKRKPKSNWSKINKEKVALLIQKGAMQKAGFESIQVAKQNGSWTFLDAIEALVLPKDLELALQNNPPALSYYKSLRKSVKKMLLYWVASAKRKETRENRISEIVENACQHQKPKQFR